VADWHECIACKGLHTHDDLEEVYDLEEKVQPGEVMPSGSCPTCRPEAFCYPYKGDQAPNTYRMTYSVNQRWTMTIHAHNEADAQEKFDQHYEHAGTEESEEVDDTFGYDNLLIEVEEE
jgi:hypothetical protein